MKIRYATAADIPAIMMLEKHAETAAHWSQDQYLAMFSPSASARLILLMEEESTVRGFLAGSAGEDEWEIENVVVTEASRARGLGSQLVKDFVEVARQAGAKAVFLEVRESNHAARRLYEKQQFLECGRRKRYYQDPEEDAVLYKVAL